MYYNILYDYSPRNTKQDQTIVQILYMHKPATLKVYPTGAPIQGLEMRLLRLLSAWEEVLKGGYNNTARFSITLTFNVIFV